MTTLEALRHSFKTKTPIVGELGFAITVIEMGEDNVIYYNHSRDFVNERTLEDMQRVFVVDWFESPTSIQENETMVSAMKAYFKSPIEAHFGDLVSVSQKQKCNCDLRSVIMVTGCKCGGV